MQELSDAVRRFQMIKAREKKAAIEKAAMRAANPTLTKEQVDAMWNSTHPPVKNVVLKAGHGRKNNTVVRK